LAHPKYGYYRSQRPIGREGDFITAPEIHQMFGELIGLWSAEVWQALGAPEVLRLVELGPGRGTLMSDILRVARVVPRFQAALDVHLVEISDTLAEMQRQKLQSFSSPLTWHRGIDALPAGPTIVIANEFFDALPIRHYVRTTRGWNERLVGLDANGRLAFGLASWTDPLIDAAAPIDALLEISPAAQATVSRLASHILDNRGALLIIDYGYASHRFGETLQAVRRHAYADPLSEPGESDLTAHVDFAALARAAAAAGAQLHGPVAQGLWLARLGIFARAAALKRAANAKQVDEIDAALRRLALPGPSAGAGASMAELFKVLCVASPGVVPPGFADDLAQE
jgi:SAM-dependent MidA family methyltransferase